MSSKTAKAIITSPIFWGLGMEDKTGYTFQATANEEDTTLFIEGPLPSHTENYYILTIETQELTEKPPTFPWLSVVVIGQGCF